jgi:hypothetical protein
VYFDVIVADLEDVVEVHQLFFHPLGNKTDLTTGTE